MLATAASTDPTTLEDNAWARPRAALVIGNGAYHRAGWAANPVNDATAIGEKLSHLGYSVTLLTDQTRAKMIDGVGRFVDTLKNSDSRLGLMFYAGRGVQVEGENYLLPVDCSTGNTISLVESSLPLSSVMTALQRTQKPNIVFLDCFRDDFETFPKNTERGLARVYAPRDTFIAFSTAPGAVTVEGDGSNSPFTSSLISHIGEAGTTVAQIMTRVRKDVFLKTGRRQMPWDTSSLKIDIALNPTAVPEIEAPKVEDDTKYRWYDETERKREEYWQLIKTTNNADLLLSYVGEYPHTEYEREALRRARRLGRKSRRSWAFDKPKVTPKLRYGPWFLPSAELKAPAVHELTSAATTTVESRPGSQVDTTRPAKHQSENTKVLSEQSSIAKAASVADLVDCSVFAPPAVTRGSAFLVQIFLHLTDQYERARFLATTTDEDAGLRGTHMLQAEIPRRSSVQVVLEGRGLIIDEPSQSIVWRGTPASCGFSARMPSDASDSSYHPVVRLSIDGNSYGRIVFQVSSLGDKMRKPGGRLAGTSARKYHQAFLSYSSEDRKEVLKRAQALRAAKIAFFQDVLSLDPGDRWEKEIYRNIDHSDLFLLFWSNAAKRSKWVLQEAEYALQQQHVRGDGLPDIVPVILEGPPPVLPPDNLRHLHFNDSIQYLIGEGKKRRWPWSRWRAAK